MIHEVHLDHQRIRSQCFKVPRRRSKIHFPPTNFAHTPLFSERMLYKVSLSPTNHVDEFANSILSYFGSLNLTFISILQL